MGFISNLFGKKSADETETKTGSMEDFMVLIRVYLQAEFAATLNITNLNAVPDLRTFKTKLHVPTQGGKLGIGEKARCKKMLKEMYEMNDEFFKEIEQSIHRRCKKPQDVQSYSLQFQAFANDLVMLTAKLAGVKLRIPSTFKKTLLQVVESSVNDIYNKNDFTDASTIKTVVELRDCNKRLGFTQQWATSFAFRTVMLAKKEKRPQNAD